jgi:hypothetical protein
LTVERLLDVSEKAIHTGFSAVGRPAWTRANLGAVEGCYLRVHGPDPTGALRCVVTVMLTTPPLRYFTLDVVPEDLRGLRRLARRAERALLLELLNHSAHVPVLTEEA